MCQNDSSYVTEFIKARDQIKKERQSIRQKKRHLTQKPAVHNAANNSKQFYAFGWNILLIDLIENISSRKVIQL